ncbi:NitT/TauT family transport system permease protein [Rhizobiales bacterium GAS191]|nr:NitT/TauT family transport system permease protein [Rhizobiales bacterium GAS191]
MSVVSEGRRAIDASALLRRRRASFYSRHDGAIIGAGAILLVLALWEFCWRMGFISPLFFSGPSAIARKFVELAGSGKLGENLAYTGINFLIGFVLALIVGVPLGIMLGWYRRLLLFFDPLITALYATPRIALYPLFIIWFGIGSSSKIFIVFLSAVLPILVNTIAGVRNIDPDLLKAARAYCASDRQIFTTVALPSSVPFILTGVRQAIAHGLIGVIIAELFAGSEGIGFMISYAGQIYATDELLVGVLCVTVAGMVLTYLAERVQRHFQRWRPQHIGGR